MSNNGRYSYEKELARLALVSAFIQSLVDGYRQETPSEVQVVVHREAMEGMSSILISSFEAMLEANTSVVQTLELGTLVASLADEFKRLTNYSMLLFNERLEESLEEGLTPEQRAKAMFNMSWAEAQKYLASLAGDLDELDDGFTR